MDRYTDTTQNRFTAYLQRSIDHAKATYLAKKRKIQSKEIDAEDQLFKNYLDFETQLHEYQYEQTAFIVLDWRRFEELISMLDNKRLVRSLQELKEKHKQILFARLFGDLSFEEIGAKFGMTAKQAENVYFYIITKLRKELEGTRDEF